MWFPQDVTYSIATPGTALLSKQSVGPTTSLSWWPRPTTQFRWIIRYILGYILSCFRLGLGLACSRELHVILIPLISTLSYFETLRFKTRVSFQSRVLFNVEDDSTRGIVYSSSFQVLATLELSYLKSILVIVISIRNLHLYHLRYTVSWWPRPTTWVLLDSVGLSDTSSATSSAVSALASVSPLHVNCTWF
jgi:hypothetical protein